MPDQRTVARPTPGAWTGRPPRPPGRPGPDPQAGVLPVIVAAVVALCLISALIGFLRRDTGTSPAAPDAVASPSAVANLSAAASPSPAAPTASAPALRRATVPASGPVAAPQRRQVAVPEHGNGKFAPVQVAQTTTATSGRVVTYSVQIEGGLGGKPAADATAVGKALLDARGWQGAKKLRFEQLTPQQRKAGKPAELTILLVSPGQVDRLCAPLPTHGRTSCATKGRAVLNYRLWMNGVVYYGDNLAAYRNYMVNHEVGHTLGAGHTTCPKPGAPAPVMLQQTLGLGGCTPWPWPQRPGTGT